MSSRPTPNPANAKFSFAALEVEGNDDDSHSESEGELVEAPLTPPPPVVTKPLPEKSKSKAAKSKAAKQTVSSIPTPANSVLPPQPPITVAEAEAPAPASAAAPLIETVAAAPLDSTPTPAAALSLPAAGGSAVPASPTSVAPVATSSSSAAARSRSPARPASRFHPDIPNLPSPPPSPSRLGNDPSMLRKRKASQDLVATPLSKELKFANDEVVPVKEESSATIVAAAADPNAERTKKKQNAITRTVWTLIMIFGFIGILLLGHAYVIVLVFVCAALAYREVTALFKLTHPPRRREDESDAWDSTLNWYFFAITNYFLYGESIIYYFKHVVFSDAQFLPFATNHRFISFMLYVIGFVGFVGSLKREYLKHQFGLFGWVHMSLLVLVVSSHFIVNNILEGLIWFWVPASLVICNDIWAYICGVTFGKTPLIKLSPKKTVEGFIGAFICTLIFAVLWGTLFMRYQYMICPVHDLGTHAWSNIQCVPNSVFVWRTYEVWPPLNAFVSSLLPLDKGIPPIPYTTFQLHCLVLATFASLVAPFGGFFASGFKRAFDLKDFGDSIPGHGGITDRMDCQFLMGMFSYVYYSALVREHHVTVGSVLQTIVSHLSAQEQVELFYDLKRYLDGAGITV